MECSRGEKLVGMLSAECVPFEWVPFERVSFEQVPFERVPHREYIYIYRERERY